MNNSQQNPNLCLGSFAIHPLEDPLTQDLSEVDLKQISGGHVLTCPDLAPLESPALKQIKKIEEILKEYTER